MKKKKRVNDNLRTVVKTMSVLFFITIMGFYLFNLYINIDISNPENQATYTATKMSKTVEEVKQENKTITQMIEEVSRVSCRNFKIKRKWELYISKKWYDSIRTRNRGNCIIKWLYNNQ